MQLEAIPEAINMAEQCDVFMSYSRTDAEVMRHISDDLRKHGFNVWNDESLEPGTPSWKDAIEAAIEGAKTVVALLSPDAKKSEWVERELDYARAQNVTIIPMIVRGSTQNAVPFELITVQRADIRTDYDDGYYQLQDALAEHLKRPDLRPPARTRPIQELQMERQLGASKVVAGKPITFDNRLYVWNPLSYLRLLALYFFNADGLLKVEPTSTRSVAAWLASTLLWLPVTINALFFKMSEIPLWGLDKPFLTLPAWIIPLGWLVTGFLGQVRFDVRSGMGAFLRGPMRLVGIVLGIGAALLYAGSLNFAQPPVTLQNGLAFLTVTSAQQLLLIGGVLSVFVGMILANNLAWGFVSWLGNWFSVGCVGLLALLFYLPIGERLLQGFGGATAASDITASGFASYVGVACVMGVVLVITVGGIAGAQRQRNVSGFSFFVLLMLVAAYGLLIWGHLIG